MKYKLLALDIDGTLIGRQEQVSAEVALAVAAADRAGLSICLATGRSYAEAEPIWRQLALTAPAQPLILVGGSLVSESGTARTLYQRTIPVALACELGEALSRAGFCAVAAFDPWRHGVNFLRTSGGLNVELQQRWLARRKAVVQVVERFADRPDMPPPLRVSTVLQSPSPDLLADLRGQFQGRLTIHRIYVPAYDLMILEAFSEGTSKHAALTYVAQAMRLGRGQIAAVGDDVNDISMIRGAGLGVAMPDAPQEVRDAARHVAVEGLAAFVTGLLAGKFD
jgi:hypothetical protein